jgi:hypothetical protein
MTALADAERRRLEQLLGMTGSVHDGEALNALRLAHRLVAGHGLTLVEALTAAAGQAIELKRLTALEKDAYERGYRKGVEDGEAPPRRPASWPAFANYLLLRHPQLLNNWERTFLASFASSGWPTPTEKQRAKLEQIALRCGEKTPP